MADASELNLLSSQALAAVSPVAVALPIPEIVEPEPAVSRPPLEIAEPDDEMEAARAFRAGG
jgi:hypothetical protein